MKILFLSRWYPYPADNGSKIRIFNLIRQLSRWHDVDLISFASGPIANSRIEAMRRYCRRVEVVRFRPFQPGRLKALLAFFSAQPRSVVDTYNLEMHQQVEQAGRERTFDVVIASQIDMALYARLLPTAARILEELELATLYEQVAHQTNSLKRVRRSLMWWKMRRYINRLLRTFDGCTVVSEAEQDHLRQVSPWYEPVEVVTNGVDVAYYADDFDLPVENSLIYTGALTYSANFDAVHFFLRDILPRIQRQRPEVKFLVTGKLAGVPVEQLPSNQALHLTGYLDDIRPSLAQSSVCVVPLREGGGTRLKILEALAIGTPVVTTRKGVEGLDLVSGRDLLIADDPADFATAVLSLLADREARERLSQNGRQAVAANYDWRIIGDRFNDFVETVAMTNQKRVPTHD